MGGKLFVSPMNSPGELAVTCAANWAHGTATSRVSGVAKEKSEIPNMKNIKTQPQLFYVPIDRRRFFKSMALASAGFTLPGYLAEALVITPQMTQGPYYPLANNIPLDKDNDLVQLNDNTSIAAGIVTYLSGRVLDAGGNPVRGSLIELWHADRGGNYIYSASGSRNAAADTSFQGFGQFLTGATGQYEFRTVKAGLYNGRTRHYHIAVTMPGELVEDDETTLTNAVGCDAGPVGLMGETTGRYPAPQPAKKTATASAEPT